MPLNILTVWNRKHFLSVFFTKKLKKQRKNCIFVRIEIFQHILIIICNHIILRLQSRLQSWGLWELINHLTLIDVSYMRNYTKFWIQYVQYLYKHDAQFSGFVSFAQWPLSGAALELMKLSCFFWIHWVAVKLNLKPRDQVPGVQAHVVVVASTPAKV